MIFLSESDHLLGSVLAESVLDLAEDELDRIPIGHVWSIIDVFETVSLHTFLGIPRLMSRQIVHENTDLVLFIYDLELGNILFELDHIY